MKKYIIALIMVFILIGCSNDKDLFNKKKECYDYNDETNGIEIYYNSKYDSCVESYCNNFNGIYDCVIKDYFTKKFYLQYKCEGGEGSCLDKYKD